MENLIIGEVIKPQGIKGEVKIKLYDNSKNLSDIKNLIVGRDTLSVKSLSVRQGFMFVVFNGFDTIQQVECFRNKKVYIGQEDALKLLQENEYFIENILEFNVATFDGQNIGKLVDVQNYGSKDIAQIESENGEILLPIVEGLIERIEEDKKLIILNTRIFEEVACYEDWHINTFSRNVFTA